MEDKPLAPSSSKLPLVSIIMPCYNGAMHLNSTLDSMLAQTYPNVEFIFVDDASTDNTNEIFSEYQQKFIHEKKWQVLYIRQEKNRHQAVAINAGLAVFSGDYLSWLDSDDLFEPTFLEKHVNFLEQNPQFGFCYSDTRVVDKSIGKDYVVRRKPTKAGIHPSAMQVVFKNDLFCPYTFCTARREAILRAIPDKHIYDTDDFWGQNMQLLIPLSYYYGCGAINETLSTYVKRKSSSSSYQRELHMETYYRMICNTIAKMDIPLGDKLYMVSYIADIKDTLLINEHVAKTKSHRPRWLMVAKKLVCKFIGNR